MVNGAAGNFLASAAKLSAKGFKTVLEIDTVGTFLMSQAVFNHSMKKSGGCIINITAELHWNGSALQAHSAAAKAGVDALTRVMACEWGPFNVRVCGICPGAIAGTEGFERLGSLSTVNDKEASKKAFENKATSKETGSDSALKTFAFPIARFGEPEDIANAALFLGSPAAAYMSGTDIVVDGGAWLTGPNLMFTSPKFVETWRNGKL